VLGLTVSMENWMAVGKAAVDWLVARPRSIHKNRCVGNSFGSFFRHSRDRERAADLRLRRQLQQSRAGLPRHLRGGEPELQEAFHVHGGLHDEAKFDASARR